MNTQENTPLWAIVELMGRNRYGGLVSKDTQFGTPMLHIDVPQKDGSMVSQLINPNSLYRLTFCEEKLARAAAEQGQSAPMYPMEIKHLLPAGQREVRGDIEAEYRDSEVVYDEPRFAS